MDNLTQFLLIAVVFALLWLIFLTGYLLYFIKKYRVALVRANKKSLTQDEAVMKEVSDRLSYLLDATKGYVQHVGLIRFNPFPEVGSTQSFAVAILDGKGDGVVISSLHSRTNSRSYAKVVIGGKSLNHELSQEEERAIEQALTPAAHGHQK